MQCSVRKGRRPKKQGKYEAENNPKYLTLLQAIKVALFRLLVVRCKTGLKLLPKTHPALLRFDEFSKTSVFPENFEKECCAQCLQILDNPVEATYQHYFYVLCTFRERCNWQWSGAIVGSFRRITFFGKDIHEWACRSWPNSWFNEMGLVISLRWIIINT